MSKDQQYELRQIQNEVSEIWQKELNVPVLQDSDDFFSQSGDSLNMLNMLFRVNSAFRIELSPGALFENPTLQGFSLAVLLAIDDVSNSDNIVASKGMITGSI